MPSTAEILEAVLFSSHKPLKLKDLKRCLGGASSKEVRQLVRGLNQFYADQCRAFLIEAVAGGFQIRTKPEFEPWIQEVQPNRPLKLTKPALEVLSIIAYQQPISRSRVDEIRGRRSIYLIKKLVRQQLVRKMNKTPENRQTFFYITTDFFLEVFGLHSVKDLPAADLSQMWDFETTQT